VPSLDCAYFLSLLGVPCRSHHHCSLPLPLFVPPFVFILLQIPFPGTLLFHIHTNPRGCGVRWSVNSPLTTRHSSLSGATPRFHSYSARYNPVMEFKRIQNAIELFGQAPPPPPHRKRACPGNSAAASNPNSKSLGRLPSRILEQRRRSLRPIRGKKFSGHQRFRDSWVEGRVPKRAVIAAALWHAAFLALPFSLLTGMPHTNPLLQNVQLTWSGRSTIFRSCKSPAQSPSQLIQRSSETQAGRAAVQPSIDAFHPRQRIFTDPVRPRIRVRHSSIPSSFDPRSCFRICQHRATPASNRTGQAAPANQRSNAQKLHPKKARRNGDRSSARRHPQHGQHVAT